MEENPATKIMAEGFVWAESVLLAVCREFDIEIDEKIIPQIAYNFAGGIGNTGSVCGAVAGAVMAIGLKRGRPKTMEDGLRELKLAEEFRRRFEAQAESDMSCRALTEIDLTTEEGMQKFMTSDIPMTVCFPAVGLAYNIVVDLLREQE